MFEFNLMCICPDWSSEEHEVIIATDDWPRQIRGRMITFGTKYNSQDFAMKENCTKKKLSTTGKD